MPSIIAQDIAEIWNGIFGSLERQLWFIVDNTDDFLPSLRVAISLDERQHEKLLLRSGIRVKRLRSDSTLSQAIDWNSVIILIRYLYIPQPYSLRWLRLRIICTLK
jgi:hypothetical protein